MEILRKLTIKSCGDWSVKRIKDVVSKVDDGQSVAIVRIAGESTGAKTGQTDKGTFTRLTGNFVGTDLHSGEIFQSGQCILPEYVGAQLGAAILQGGKSVRFAFEISAKRSDTSVTGYEYTVKPLMQAEPTDAMKELMGIAGIVAPKLAAPAEPAAPATPAEPAAAPAAPAPASSGKSSKK